MLRILSVPLTPDVKDILDLTRFLNSDWFNVFVRVVSQSDIIHVFPRCSYGQ